MPALSLIKNSLFCLLALALLTACAEERPPIDRVQPYALEKAYFVGPNLVDTSDDPEFWTQGTLIDVGYGAGQDGLFTSTYAQPMSRIKWEITEDMLIGRIAYERIDDSDGKGLGGRTQDGVVAVAFRILSHFDIENAYNPTTGEQLNIVMENFMDRPWFERTHFRVDWSRNLNVDSYDFDTLSLVGVYGGITYEPMAYDITDPNHPDAPVLDLENGYFDVTTRAFARPGVIDLGYLGWGIRSFPACFLPNDFLGGTAPAGSCNPIELTLRHSFRRVEDTDYEPMDWDGYRFKAYGAFTVERKGYARNFGMTDDRWRRFITRYNIWERSHYYDDPERMRGGIPCFTPETTPYGADPHRDEDNNGTADECEAVGNGSRCDEFKQLCTLPYQERVAKPIVWYYTEGSDMAYYDATRDATSQWDTAMRVAVQSSRYAECKRVGKSTCDQEFPVYPGQQDMNEDALNLTAEINACKAGRIRVEYGGDPQRCDALADEIATTRGYHPGVAAIAKQPRMVVLCHSPVEAGDPAECGEQRLQPGLSAEQCSDVFADPWGFPRQPGKAYPELYELCREGLSVRPGDLRYHQVNVIPTPQTPSPWGIYTDAEDPLTGETVSASINVWSWVNDVWSQTVIDKIRFAKGELTADDITDADYVENWSDAAVSSSRGGLSPKMTAEDVAERVAQFAKVDVEAIHDHPHELTPEMRQQSAELLKELSQIQAIAGAPSQAQATYRARAAQAQGTEFEAELMTPMVQRITGIDGLPLSEEVLDRASPLRGGHLELEQKFYHLKQVALGERGACVLHEAPVPVALSGLGTILEKKFGAFNPGDDLAVQQERAEKMRRYIARRAHTTVIQHEMGHSVGMRHNFVSSSDAMSFRPQYWQLRTKNGTVNQECTTLSPDGESCVGPRYFDPVTPEEDANLITMFMQSSVMEYPGEQTQEFLGLGAYDFAATRMFYGDVVSVFQEADYAVSSAKAPGLLFKMDSFGGILGFTWFNGPNSTMHYSQLQDFYQLIRACRVIDVADYAPDDWNNEVMGPWDPVLDGGLVAVDGEYQRCGTPPVDYLNWDQLRNPSSAEASINFSGGPAIDAQGRIRVPYGFGTDSWADVGNLSVYRGDNGADPYELFDFFISRQEVDHIFDNYRRNRNAFSVRGAAGRTLGRYNAKLRDAAKGLGLYRNIFSQAFARQGVNVDVAWPAIANINFKDNIIAAGMAFDHFARILARPEHGEHYKQPTDEVLKSKRDAFFLAGTPNTKVIVPNGTTGLYGDVGIGGRPLENTLANDQGEYDNNFTMNAGSYYEKMYASMLFTESADNFISASRSDFVDGRYRAVSLADLFPDGYRRLLGNFLTGDDFIKGARVAADENGEPLVNAGKFAFHPLGWTSWWGTEPRVCFPNRGTSLCSTVGNDEGTGFDALEFFNTVPIDPQVGWEQQKFLIAWTLLYLLDNQKQYWLDQMRIWELNVDAVPLFDDRIEFHHPSGRIYMARTFGKETLFGKTVQKGIGARVLEYANNLLRKAYDVEPGPDLDGDGEPDWFIPAMGENGRPSVQFELGAAAVGVADPADCNAQDNSGCTCAANNACLKLRDYVSVPFFMRQAVEAYGLGMPAARGIY